MKGRDRIGKKTNIECFLWIVFFFFLQVLINQTEWQFIHYFSTLILADWVKNNWVRVFLRFNPFNTIESHYFFLNDRTWNIDCIHSIVWYDNLPNIFRKKNLTMALISICNLMKWIAIFHWVLDKENYCYCGIAAEMEKKSTKSDKFFFISKAFELQNWFSWVNFLSSHW